MHFQPPYTGILTQGRNTEIYTTRTFIVACALREKTLNLRDSRIRTALQQTPFSTCLLAHRVYTNEYIQILFKHCFCSVQIYSQILICSQQSVQLPHHSQTPIVGSRCKGTTFFSYMQWRAQKKDSLTIVRPPTIQYPNNPFRLDPLQPQNREPTIFGCLILK